MFIVKVQLATYCVSWCE